MHEYFLAQQDVRNKQTKHDKLDNCVILKIHAIPNWTTNKEKLTTLKKLEDLHLSLSKKMDVLVLKSFTCYPQLLSPALFSKWDDIIQEYCFTAG